MNREIKSIVILIIAFELLEVKILKVNTLKRLTYAIYKCKSIYTFKFGIINIVGPSLNLMNKILSNQVILCRYS